MNEYTFPTRNEETVVSFIIDILQQLLKKYAIHRDAVYGIGVGLPGVVDYEEGIVLLSDQLYWRDVPLADLIKQQINCHVSVDNELKLKALAEVLMDDDPYESVVTIGVGKGIGSALIVHGEIYRGKDNFAGEIGHMTVNPYGNYCSCGQQGCLNTYVSTVYIVEEAKRISQIETMEDIVLSYEQHVPWARNLLQKVVTYIGVAINNVIRAYNPDVIYLSGELVERFPVISELVLKQYEEQTIQPRKIVPLLRVTGLNENDVVLGAGMGMMQQFIHLLDMVGHAEV